MGNLIESEKVLATGVLVIGLLIMVGTLAYGVSKWAAAADVTSVLAAMGSVVGSLVGAFFGFMAGAAGRNRAERVALLAGATLDRVVNQVTDANVKSTVDEILKGHYADVKLL